MRRLGRSIRRLARKAVSTMVHGYGRCSCCGDTGPLVIAFKLPDIASQLKLSGHNVYANSEHCIADGRHFIRCVLRVPVQGGGIFEWGAWAEVSKEDFEAYKAGSLETMPGKLANLIPGYLESTLNVRAIVCPTGTYTRPNLKITDPQHQLTQEQNTGMPANSPQAIQYTRFAFSNRA